MVSVRCLQAVVALTCCLLSAATVAQPPGPPPPARSPRVAAQDDVPGNWVAKITVVCSWSMITPPNGVYSSVPLTPLVRQVADSWDPAADAAAGEACRVFGAGGIMRLPTRLKIAWMDYSTLRIETDSGGQIRTLHFGRAAAADAAPSWQGHSVAEWLGVPAPANPLDRKSVV